MIEDFSLSEIKIQNEILGHAEQHNLEIKKKQYILPCKFVRN